MVCPEDRIQFPNFEDIVEQKVEFEVWTSITGTYHVELYWDGDLVYQSGITNIPSSGRFGVRDAIYNPNNWPYDGFYEGDEFALDVTVTPSGALINAPATARVVKKVRRRSANRVGVTVSQGGALGGSIGANSQQEFDNYLQFYMSADWAGSLQVDFGGALLDEISSPPLVINSTNNWRNLEKLMDGTNFFSEPHITDLYYFGHGWNAGIGSGNIPGENITLATLNRPGYLVLFPMSYVFLDGCNTAKKPDLIKALIGLKKQMNRQTLVEKGLTPAFGAGWKSLSATGYYLSGTLRYKHFDWVADFYMKLSERDFNGNGYLNKTFRDAIDFANHPQGAGINPNWNDNDEGDELGYFGCTDCFFDEFRQ